jgi:choloylglycine hydrolase
MKNRLTKLSVALLAVFALQVAVADACTWFRFLNDQKHCFIGRTLEWPGDLHSEITRVPRGHDFGKFKAEHGFVGVSHNGPFSDGLNEHGLAISALWLSESKYAPPGPDTWPITDLIPLVLGQAKTVDEAIALVKDRTFTGGTAGVFGKIDITAHFEITDETGRSVVVEFLDGKPTITENKVGALTNDPNFGKQMEIWSKYDPKKFNEESFEAFDYSPEGRFCRMAAMNATQVNVPDDITAVNRAWSMVNAVDIPKGILYWRWVNNDPQFTSYSIVADLSERVYYFRTWNNYDIRKVALKDIDFANTTYKADSMFTPSDYKEYKF